MRPAELWHDNNNYNSYDSTYIYRCVSFLRCCSLLIYTSIYSMHTIRPNKRVPIPCAGNHTTTQREKKKLRLCTNGVSRERQQKKFRLSMCYRKTRKNKNSMVSAIRLCVFTVRHPCQPIYSTVAPFSRLDTGWAHSIGSSTSRAIVCTEDVGETHKHSLIISIEH